MASFQDAIGNGARAALCNTLRVGTAAPRFVESIGFPSFGPNAPTKALLQWACDIPPEDAPPPIEPPFEGGQCPVFYNLSLLVTSDEGTSPGNGVPETAVGLGPLSIEQFTGTNSIGYRVRESGGGIVLSRSLNTPVNNLGYQFNVTRQDGMPDDCGNPPFDPLPPWPPGGEPTTGPVTYVNNEGDEVTIEGDWNFLIPIVNINGEIEVPVEVSFSPELQFRGTLNLTTGGFTFSPSFVLPGRGGGTPDQPVGTPVPPASDEPVTDDKQTELIRAVVVVFNVQGNRQATELLYDDQPVTFAPRLGVVRFAIAVPDSDVAVWTGDIPIKNSRQWIDCPSPYGAVDVVVSPDPGSGNVVTQVTAIRGPCPCG